MTISLNLSNILINAAVIRGTILLQNTFKKQSLLIITFFFLKYAGLLLVVEYLTFNKAQDLNTSSTTGAVVLKTKVCEPLNHNRQMSGVNNMNTKQSVTEIAV